MLTKRLTEIYLLFATRFYFGMCYISGESAALDAQNVTQGFIDNPGTFSDQICVKEIY